MASGGGEPSAPVNGGDFLLQLLQKPPHHPPQQPQQQQSQFLSHDPAVAALGPSLPIPLPIHLPWLHHQQLNSPPTCVPHNFFAQNPNASSILNPNFDSTPPSGFSQATRQQQNVQLDNVRRLGVLGPNHKPSLDQQDLIFGSLKANEYVINGGSSESMLFSQHSKGKTRMPLPKEGIEASLGSTRRLNGLEVENQQNTVDSDRALQGNLGRYLVRERSESKSTVTGNNYGRQGHNGHNYGTAAPPPGFSSKQKTGGYREYANRRNVVQMGGRGRNNSAFRNEKSSGDRLVDRKVSDQLDYPGPPRGSNFHSVSASDIEESMIELHREDGVRGEKTGIWMRDEKRDDKGSSDIDDLEEQLADSLGLDDESGEGSNNKKQHRTRDKDYRSDKRGQSVLGQRMRIMKARMSCRTDIGRWNAPFLAIYESLIPLEEEKAKQKQLLSLLEKIVSKEWPDARLYIYGSCANSFGFPKSDIDVCLTLGNSEVNKSEVLLKLAEMLQSENLQNVQALTRARVPIVKLMDPETGISCDICINNMLAVVNTKLLRDYALIDVRLRQLAFIVKHWAKSRGVNETYQGTLSSYAYVLMCIHFLQQRRPPILPCLQEMRTTHYVTVDGIVCAYFDQVESLVGFGSNNNESIAQLVWGFFNYWAYCHNYANDVICIRTGTILSKRSKDWTRRIGNDRHLICIEDPFEVSHDLGRVVDKRSIRVLKEEFERAADIMQYGLNPCEALFQPYVPS